MSNKYLLQRKQKKNMHGKKNETKVRTAVIAI